MNCGRCGIELEERRISWVQPFQGRYFLLESVPVLMCPRCEDESITPMTHDAILTYLQQEPQPLRLETLTVLDLQQVL